MPISKKKIDYIAVAMGTLMVKSVEQFQSELEDWEKTHLASFKAQLEQNRPLSVNKQKILKGIHQRRLQAHKYDEMNKGRP